MNEKQFVERKILVGSETEPIIVADYGVDGSVVFIMTPETWNCMSKQWEFAATSSVDDLVKQMGQMTPLKVSKR